MRKRALSILSPGWVIVHWSDQVCRKKNWPIRGRDWSSCFRELGWIPMESEPKTKIKTKKSQIILYFSSGVIAHLMFCSATWLVLVYVADDPLPTYLDCSKNTVEYCLWGAINPLGYRYITHSRSITASDSVQRDGFSICDRESVLVWSQILYCQRIEIWVNT